MLQQDLEMEDVQVDVMSDNEQQMNVDEFKMFGNPNGEDHIEEGEAKKSAAFGRPSEGASVF